MVSTTFLEGTGWKGTPFVANDAGQEQRGAAQVIKCKLCPQRYAPWTTFRRHCKQCEDHPLGSEVKFCALLCAAKKRWKILILGHFEPRPQHCLRTGQEEAWSDADYAWTNGLL